MKSNNLYQSRKSDHQEGILPLISRWNKKNTPPNKIAKRRNLIPKFSWGVKYLILVLWITSCAPQSKESYLKQYKEFITEVRKNMENYTKDDWKKKDQEYERFIGKWYEKFKDDFIWEDNTLLAKYEFQYNLYRSEGNSFELFKDLLKDYGRLKEQVKFYAENDMEKDLDSLKREAKEIGETATETLDEVFKEFEKNTK